MEQRACPVAQKWPLASSKLQNTFLRLDFFFYSRKSFLTKAADFGDVSFQTIMVSAHYLSAVKPSSPQVNIYLTFSPCQALLWLLRIPVAIKMSLVSLELTPNMGSGPGSRGIPSRAVIPVLSFMWGFPDVQPSPLFIITESDVVAI